MRFGKWSFFDKRKDGGEQSHVTAYFLAAIKPLFTIGLLHFADGTREAFHSHAFNAVTLVLSGRFREEYLDGKMVDFKAGDVKYTPRKRFHKVRSFGDTWALTFRGPWANTWKEYRPDEKRFVTLTHGRQIIESKPVYSTVL
jgi:mannose-6-phosphate isomerase-like protein (cupin superfamily)